MTRAAWRAARVWRLQAARRVLPDWTAGTITLTLLLPHRRGQLPSVKVVADEILAMLSGANPGAQGDIGVDAASPSDIDRARWKDGRVV